MNDYPIVLTIFMGLPITIGGIIAFAIVSDGDGEFNTTELAIFAAMMLALVVLGVIDQVRWRNWKRRNRR